MNYRLKDYIVSLGLTVIVLVVFEILSSTLLPVLGISNYRFPASLLVVLFLGFKLDTPYLAILIIVVQYFHSFFSVEGWEIGTIAGIFICIVISYLRELIHLSSTVVTVITTQIFQLVWLGIVSLLIYLKLGDMTYIYSKLWRFIPESIVASLASPFIFFVLDRIWSIGASQKLEGNA